MLYQRLKKTDKGYFIQLPDELIAQLKLEDGDTVAVEIQSVPHATQEELKQAFEASWQVNQDGYRYLSNR